MATDPGLSPPEPGPAAAPQWERGGAPLLTLAGTRSPTRLTSSVRSADPLSRWAIAVFGACALLVAFIQAPGKIVSDTKLPLIMSPITYMTSSLHLWDSSMWSGSIQTLSFGYLFPMGAFFAAGHALHVPVWCTERVWLALLLTVGWWGAVSLAEALGIGNRLGRVLGAIAYIVSPIVVTWAAITAALLAVVLLPWVLLPLVRGASGGSPRRAAFASGVAVALMGGDNATVILATLPVGAVWLLTRQPGPRRRALIGWWVVALVLACFWWAAALSIENHFGYDYLPYTETAALTTSTTSLFETLRGASFWTDHFTIGGPLIPGAWTLVSSIGPIIGTTVVSALGLAGLARRIPEKLFLVATLAVGVVVIAAGYGGSLGGPLAGSVQNLLGGPLAILRNVSKFSPDVALPLSLGFMSVLSAPLHVGPRTRSTLRRASRFATPAIVALGVGALVLASTPFWQAQLYPRGAFSAIPSYWDQTARWLDAHQDHGTALLVPGADFGEYTWGRPLDEPLSVLASSSWSVRNIVPFGSDGNDQVLDTVEASLDQGVAEPGMAAYLARAGFDYVVVRNDLDLAATNAPPPAQVHQVLSQTSGLRQVASFGPLISRHQSDPSGMSSVYDSPSTTTRLRSVVIYRVMPPAPIVRTYPASDPVVVSGSPSSLLPLLTTPVLQDRAAVLAGDPDGGAAAAGTADATWADTDGNQRRDVAFGAIRDNDSYVLGPGQRTFIAQPNVPQNLAVVSGAKHQTVADPLGAASVSASTFSSSPLSLDSAQGPSAAFDDDQSTSWVGDATNDSVGQWIQINFGRSLDLHRITVRPLADVPQRPEVTGIEISTSRGSVGRSLRPGNNSVPTPPGPSTWLRITLTKVQRARARPLGGGLPLGAGLTTVQVPGVDYIPALRVPNDEASAFAQRPNQVVYSFAAPLANATLNLGDVNDDDPLVVRRFSEPGPTKLTMVGLATPTPGPALTALLPRVSSSVHVTSSSVLGQLPRFSASNLLTGSGQPWIAGQGDARPSVTFTWSGDRTVSSIVLTPTRQAARPRAVVISSAAGRVTEPVPAGGGTVRFPPMSTDSLTVRFVRVAHQTGQVPATATRVVLPVGLKDLSIPALGRVHATAPANGTFDLPCGEGPAIRLDGAVLPTRVLGTVADLENLRPMGLLVCGGPVTVRQGSHVLVGGRLGGTFKVTLLQALPVDRAPATTPARPARIVGAWTSDHREVQVSAGAATYLAVAQNYDEGWKATLDGRLLTPVRLDGWQQAWLVPAGAGGTVVMVLPADTWYRMALLVGAVLVALLVALALVRRGRSDREPANERRRPPFVVLAMLGVAVLVLVCGPIGLVLIPLLYVARRWRWSGLVLVAVGAMVAAGIEAAASPGASAETGLGAFGWPAQVLCAVAFAAVLASLVAPERTGPAGSDP